MDHKTAQKGMGRKATIQEMKRATNKLVNGDALNISDYDLIAQTIDLPMGVEPRGDNWHILTGNVRTNYWARIAYRNECK